MSNFNEGAKMTWNKFLSECSWVWADDCRTNIHDIVRHCLRSCDKTPKMSKIQVAAAAYKLYKETDFSC